MAKKILEAVVLNSILVNGKNAVAGLKRIGSGRLALVQAQPALSQQRPTSPAPQDTDATTWRRHHPMHGYMAGITLRAGRSAGRSGITCRTSRITELRPSARVRGTGAAGRGSFSRASFCRASERSTGGRPATSAAGSGVA
jgi:hypothetical protein